MYSRKYRYRHLSLFLPIYLYVYCVCVCARIRNSRVSLILAYKINNRYSSNYANTAILINVVLYYCNALTSVYTIIKFKLLLFNVLYNNMWINKINVCKKIKKVETNY